jgi:hypothetical protein
MWLGESEYRGVGREGSDVVNRMAEEMNVNKSEILETNTILSIKMFKSSSSRKMNSIYVVIKY